MLKGKMAQPTKDSAMAVPKNAKSSHLRNKLNPIKPNPRVLTETGFNAKIKKRLHGLGA